MSVSQEEFERFQESMRLRMEEWERRQAEYERRRQQEREEDRAEFRRGLHELRRAGLRFIRDIQSQMTLLIDGQLRIEEAVERLAEQQDRTAKSLQSFIDSLRTGGDGRGPARQA